jgi:hypothetical protein
MHLDIKEDYPTQDAQCCNSFAITKLKDDKFYVVWCKPVLTSYCLFQITIG